MGRVRRLADLAGVLARASSGQILSFDDSGDIQSTPSSSGTTVYADMAALIAATGMSSGDQALVTATNNIYIYNGSGWYKIATVQNDSPSAITGVSGTYSLATDGTPTVITAVSTDPEGFPLTWTYSTSGLGSIATVSQADNVFTITPSTDLLNAGTFSITITASDGVNVATKTSSISLVNDPPSAITGVAGSYTLAENGTPTVITAVSTDPEGTPLTWSYTTNGLGSIATVSQVGNVFTITPSTNTSNGGTFSLTLSATDGFNSAVSATTNLTLTFTLYVENSKYTTLLVTATGTSDNNDITDSSSSNHTITVNGDAQAGTFSPYRHGGYSTYFDGTSDYIQVPAGAFALSTGAFTIETWVYFNSITTGAVSDSFQYMIYDARSSSSPTDHFMSITTSGDVRIRMDGIRTIELDETLEAGKWYHLALVNSGGTVTLFLNGTANATTFTTSANLSIGSAVEIGGSTNSANYWLDGYLRDFRVVIGTAVYTSNFTPPIEPLTAITNTSLLTCHLPYIADGSSNAHAITVNDNVSTRPFAPYDHDEYSAADHGGSVYFDGTGDALVLNSSTGTDFTFGTGDFTIEAWVYPTTITNSSLDAIFTLRHSGNWNDGDGGLTMTIGGFHSPINGGHTNYPSGTLQANMWTHLAFVRSSGTFKIYRNGLEDYSGAMTHDFSSSYDPGIGVFDRVDTASGRFYWTGHITDVRVKKSAEYTSNFSPSTSPLSSTGSVFHLKGTDASIIDKTQHQHNLELFSNTKGSTTQTKFANTKSMYFKGSQDYVVVNHEALGTGNWTIEGWVYFISTSTSYVFDFRNSTNTNPALALQSGDWRYITDSNYRITSGVNPSTNTWYHFAIVKNNGTTTLYVNGSSIGTYADSLNYVGNSAGSIGKYHLGDFFLNGYLQDFRVSKGLARYTANFTPPTEPLKG